MGAAKNISTRETRSQPVGTEVTTGGQVAGPMKSVVPPLTVNRDPFAVMAIPDKKTRLAGEVFKPPAN